jgi:hypothetical protein
MRDVDLLVVLSEPGVGETHALTGRDSTNAPLRGDDGLVKS